MKPGIYALISLDGAPLDVGECEALGVRSGTSDEVHTAPGIAVRAVDFPAAEPSVHVEDTPDDLVVFAGFLDEPEQLAAELGEAGRGKTPARLAALALGRFGDHAAQKMIGEWSLLYWDVRARTLTLLGSEGSRDPMFWASSGARVAVAPDMLRLGALPWVGLSLDPQGFALNAARAGLRRMRTEETIWRGIRAVIPATREIFSSSGCETIAPADEPAAVVWTGDFAQAIEALDALGRRIVAQNMRRYERSAFLLSGGLDSSLLTSFGAYERDAGADMFCLTSAAPEDSGLRDEREFAAAVAGQLGVRMRLVAPPAEARVYRASGAAYAFEGEPLAASRHYLYSALQAAAADENAKAMFDGVMGEMSITEKPLYATPVDPLRRVVYAARRWRTERLRRSSWPGGAFHVRLAAPLLSALPTEWQGVWTPGMPQQARLAPEALRGLHPAVAKNRAVPTATAEGVRRLFPFRDRRLLRFAAGLPYGYGEHNGQGRAMAVALLQGRVPDAVRLRPRGMPFSPDYEQRMRQQAPEARQRIPLYEEAGVGKWIDLPWLAGALDRLAAGADSYDSAQTQAQPSSLAAEFLLWCRQRNIDL